MYIPALLKLIYFFKNNASKVMDRVHKKPN